jgi:hypothetical protein
MTGSNISPEGKALLISNCLVAVMSSPEAWRTFEHEAAETYDPELPFGKTFIEWAQVRAAHMARQIWERTKPPA